MKEHPRHRHSARWWLAKASATNLVVGLLIVLAALSLLFAAVFLISENPVLSAPYRDHGWRVLWLSMATFRALLGVDDFPRQTDNAIHDALATASAMVGALVPALILGVVLIRIFAIRAFEWRSQINVCLAAELEGNLAVKMADGRHGYIAVRWYKRLKNLSIVNLKADAYLRYRTVSSVDGSTMYRYQQLKVLNTDGVEADTCAWQETFSGMPFTLWIPLHAPVSDRQVTELQGHTVSASDDRPLVVRLSGQISGLSTQISDEHRYYLDRDIQVGRFVPVEPDVDIPEQKWAGWRRFDQPIDHGLFVYGELCHPDTLVELVGHWPHDGEVQRVWLNGFLQCWEACADNTDPKRRATYYGVHTGHPDPIQVLLLALRPQADNRTRGLLVRVDAEHIAALDLQHEGYRRQKVTKFIEPVDGPESLPDVVWTYVTTPQSQETVRRALASGTARLHQQYLERVKEALRPHDQLLEDLMQKAPPPNVPVVSLDRTLDQLSRDHDRP